MKHATLLYGFLIVQVSLFGQKDSIYFKKIQDSATSLIKLKEGYNIFSQKFGTGEINLLLLHGGPINSHEGFEIFLDKLPLDKYTIIFYDQLGSYYSDQPNDTTLWNIPRFLDEVEQVRQFYKLSSFYLLGHSWGGLLAIEYAIKYPNNIKGLIISNKSYSQQNLINTRKRLAVEIAQKMNSSEKTIQEIKSGTPISDSIEARKVSIEFGKQHLVRLNSPPDAIKRVGQHMAATPKYINSKYFHDRDQWNSLDRLYLITHPTLLISSKYDFVEKDELIEMKKRIKNSKLVICPFGGHYTFWDDSEHYFRELEKFIRKTEKKYNRKHSLRILLQKSLSV